MADSRQLRRLMAYNQWADERILTALDGLAAEELSRPREAYFGTIAANVRHTLVAQRNWLARWRGEAPRHDETIARALARGVRGDPRGPPRRSSPGSPTPTPIGCCATRISAGTPREVVLAHAITHVVNHGTAHRAETGLLLERLGRSPGDLDYIFYCFEHP